VSVESFAGGAFTEVTPTELSEAVAQGGLTQLGCVCVKQEQAQNQSQSWELRTFWQETANPESGLVARLEQPVDVEACMQKKKSRAEECPHAED
jgi:hypothetical protein